MLKATALFRVRLAMPALPVVLLCLATGHGHALALDYRIDYVHSRVEFFCSHLGFTKSRGEFRQWEGTLRFDSKDWSKSDVNVVIDMTSLDLNNEAWNRSMLGRRYFNAEQFPKAHFRSTEVRQLTATSGYIAGALTLMGITQPHKIEFVVNKIGRHPLTLLPTIGFSGKSSLSRAAFGVRADQRMVGDTVELHFELEASRVPARSTNSKR